MPILKSKTSRVDSRVEAATDFRVRATDVKKVFTRSNGEVVRAVDGVSMTVDPGKMLVLLGPSGCGKTTLLRCIAGLERPDAGEIWTNGTHVYSKASGIDVPPEARNLGMMFQSYAVWPHMMVRDNVAFPLVSRGVKKSEIGGRVQRVLDRVGIGHLGDQYPNRLSGGQQQRVALARSLVVDPQVVLFDEPLSNVDAKVREDLRVELATQQQEISFAGLYVTHDQVEALSLADHVAVLREGKVEQLGTPEDVYHRPATRYVANFVGRVNEVEGTVASRIDGYSAIDTPLGRVVGISMNGDIETGDRAVAVIRPESLTARPQAGEVNTFTGTVIRSQFTGSYVDHLVQTGDEIFRVSEMGRSTEAYISGAELELSASSDDILIYAI